MKKQSFLPDFVAIFIIIFLLLRSGLSFGQSLDAEYCVKIMEQNKKSLFFDKDNDLSLDVDDSAVRWIMYTQRLSYPAIWLVPGNKRQYEVKDLITLRLSANQVYRLNKLHKSIKRWVGSDMTKELRRLQKRTEHKK